MGKAIISTSLEAARRLVVTKQHLAGKLPPKPTTEHILSVVRDLAYVQWDPIAAIAPSHVISLWSRLGNFQLTDLDRLLWDEKKLFQHWAPIAMIVLIEDYPLYYSLMSRYPESLTKSWGSQRVRARKFLARHVELRKRILNQLKNGLLQLSQFKDYVKTQRNPDGWTSGSDVSQMLSHMQMSGEVMVVGHEGSQNTWGLSERFLPSWTKRTELLEEEFELEVAQRAIRALGTASPREIHYYFVRGRYQNLKKALELLEKESLIHRVSVAELGGSDERYIHDQDIELLESVNSDAWQPRMSLLAPFDNLIVGRDRTNRLFGFDYVHEQFLPAEKRKFGTFVLPILWGEKLIARADMLMDRKNEKLLINSVHAEPGAPGDKEVASKIAEVIERFAEFSGPRKSHTPLSFRKSGRIPSAERYPRGPSLPRLAPTVPSTQPHGLIRYRPQQFTDLSVLDPMTGIGNLLAEAAGQASKYEWMKAAEAYGAALDRFDRTESVRRSGQILEELAASYFKAAFQSDARQGFKDRMALSEKVQEELAALYERVGSHGLAKRAQARALFARFWLQDRPEEQRTALEKCIPLAVESSQILEVQNEKKFLIETLRDLVTYWDQGAQNAPDRKSLVDHVEKALETAWRVIDEFRGIEDQVELETINALTRLYVYAGGIIEQPRYDELEKKLARIVPRISDLVSQNRTAISEALAGEAMGIITADLQENLPKALESLDARVSKAKETRDYYLLGRLYTLASAWSRFSGLTEEYADQRKEQLDRALEYASKGIQYLEPSSPRVWLKYAYKRYMDSSTYIALTVETDFEKKRALLRKAIDTTRRALIHETPSFVTGTGHELSKAMYFLATMETTGPEEKSRILNEALPIREETVRTVTTFTPHSWNRGVMLNYQALLRSELSKSETSYAKRVELLKQASSDMKQCIELLSTSVAPANRARLKAQYNEWQGDVLQDLYEATHEASASQEAIAAYREAISNLSESGTVGPIPSVRWKVARCQDSLREFAESSESFRQAAREYRTVTRKIPALTAIFEDFAQYMEAWAIIEEARLNHDREEYTQAAEQYAKAAEALKKLNPWTYLSSHYSACSFLELGEAMSRQERYNAAIESFNSAIKTFQRTRTELESRITGSFPPEKREMNSWLDITKGRAKYSSARLQLEEAKVLDSRMEEEASSIKYKIAGDSFRSQLSETLSQSTRAELETLSTLCEAWSKMKMAEARASPELYSDAAKIFVLVEVTATDKKTKLAALANASMCKALEYGSSFRRTRDIQLFEAIKKNLETAADFYQEAGLKKAEDWTRGTQRLFDALRYLRDAEIEPEPAKRAELFHLAENHLQLAANIYGEAGYAKKKQEALRHLERAREEKQLLLMPIELLSENPTGSDVTISPVSLLEENAPGLERLRNPHLKGNITISNTEVNAGETLNVELQIVNIGKETATLGRIENLILEGLEPFGEKEAYFIEDHTINMRGKRLDHLKTHVVKISLRSKRAGAYQLKPRITFFDDRGSVGTCEVEPRNVAVRTILERRLSAIMFTDMIGYTSLSQRDEALSLRLLGEHRILLRSLFPRYGGREIKTMGDAFLIEFASALEAVKCALDIQRALNESNLRLPPENRIALRIGVHLGDVTYTGDDIYGDAVNVASRIEPLAEPGGICVSDQVYAQVKNKFEFPIVNLGTKRLKNVQDPMEVYKIVLPWQSEKPPRTNLESSS